jgi:hypothetical protein
MTMALNLAAHFPRVSNDVLRQLVPYIALGFAPSWTPSNELACGIYALAFALKATAIVHNRQLQYTWDPEQIKRLLFSPLYKERVLKGHEDVWNAPKEQFTAFNTTTNVDMTQLMFLLETINILESPSSQADTPPFALGIVTPRLEKPGTFSAAVHIGPDHHPLGPVVWLYNNNKVGIERFEVKKKEAASLEDALAAVESLVVRGLMPLFCLTTVLWKSWLIYHLLHLGCTKSINGHIKAAYRKELFSCARPPLSSTANR